MRDFAASPEPSGEVAESGNELSFVIQKHAARSLHYDFRLELDGTLKSWAVPKGPSLDPSDKRMAVEVEDHPLSYASFEGTIPPKHYGAGTVIVWDRGSWVPEGDARAGLKEGHIKFELKGEKLHGRWALVRMKPRANERQPAWLLIKERDDAARPASEFNVVEAEPDSVLTRGRTAKAAAERKAATASKPATKAKAGKTAALPTALPKGTRITHPERVIDADSGITKGDLIAYYAAVAPLLLPHLKARPVALLRATAGVQGQQFFQKHADSTELLHVKLLDPSLDPGHEALMEITDLDGLLSTAQMNTIELHTWNATTRAITKPDRMVFDLDPGEGVAWPQVQEAATLLHAMLDEVGLKSFVKTSGGKGLHVVVPLRPRLTWETVKRFSQAIVVHLAETIPERFVAKSGPKNRVGKVYVDYLRNGWGSTTACAWSARARPGLGVSVPIDWKELAAISGGAHWTIATVAERLPVGNTPWNAYGESRQGLARAMKALGFKDARATP
jgi:DNA ligase D-like protein (predicted polymerase)/DNA ligase D-like protein (predicted 3'-phosphoesterase)